MSGTERGFPDSEYRARLKRAQSLMADRDLAALFLTTEPEIQREMIADLDRNRVAWIILLENVPGDPDFRRRAYRGADPLDTWIRARFREAARFGRYSVWKRSPS